MLLESLRKQCNHPAQGLTSYIFFGRDFGAAFGAST